MTTTNDPYLLRRLLWCGPCEVHFVCINKAEFDPQKQAHVPKRHYKCPLGCRRELLSAEAIESQAWTEAERRATISDIQPPCRQSVLEMLLVKVVIGRTFADVEFTWLT
ncbi:hypothetical protein [Micromonospora cathayae]|uniref:Uncharacterized protein n=1 Tax=Micromonospora cathayae TaxID=3028804 RepID=A0ABY7ZML3_9ACTN|nr:hypothetical protein [Micromonospora sp. HUAS 3]WDZ84001.1 hypothetical protein PVK37_26595 [Micromonospora sp. HUAS 3]